MEDKGALDDVTDIRVRKRRTGLYVILAVAAIILLLGPELLRIYVDALWFESVGYPEIYWYKFRLGGVLFLVFFVATFVLLRGAFKLLERALPQLAERPTIRLEKVEDLRDVNILPFIFRPVALVVSLLVAFFSATGMSGEWPTFALFLNGIESGVSDSIFAKDVSFYLFTLPAVELVSGWLSTIAFILFVVIAAASGYAWYIEKSRVFGSETAAARRGIAAASAAGALLVLALAIDTYLGRFNLLYGTHALYTGVTYTDENVRLPALNALAIVLAGGALLLALNAVVFRRLRVIAVFLGVVIVTWLVGLAILPQAIYSLSVRPNELAKESPYIQKNIDATRVGFAIDRFEERQFEPAPTLTVETLTENRLLLDNIRLWDEGALQSTLRQIQEIRTYYDFREPDVDRYTIGGQPRQVLLAPRELNINQLPEQSRTWINQHLIFTHGYGVTMCPVNEFTPEGLPRLILKNMPVESEVPEIKVTRPEIYFGEVTAHHVYVDTEPQGTTLPEFSYPAPDNTDAYTKYQGKAGIPVGGLLRRAAFAIHLGDGNSLLFADAVTPKSRVLIKRNIVERVQTLAPFLLLDADPYIVITDEGRLKWIIDAFTTSDRYPYSTRYRVGDRSANYVRNSIKVVIDAYEGDVVLYVFEPDDPIIKSYRSIFPSLFTPAEEMPDDLKAHIRYPKLMASTQANVYTLYQMRNAQTFYNREDLWSIATAESTGQQGEERVAMEPYFVLMRIPGEEEQLEFVSILPFTPAGPGRNNMIGWMATRSNPEFYGQTLVFKFPKNITVTGPAQIRARFNQDARLSERITLWNQQGSRVLRGNLQVIPIADSLLYIEPFYLQAVNSPQPELRQVAVATQDRLAVDETFDKALNALFAELGHQVVARRDAATPAADSAQPGVEQPVDSQTVRDPQIARLIKQAQQLIADYGRLSAEGKHSEAGQKLDQLRQTLGDLDRRLAAE